MTAYTRWHKGKNGKPAPCTATKRACPYGRHYDTLDDAYDIRERIYSDAKEGEKINFEYAVSVKKSGLEQVPEERSSFSLRETSERALRELEATGHRVKFPTGKIDVDFGSGVRIVASRETFTFGNTGRTKWRVTYFNGSGEHEVDQIELKPTGRQSYIALQSLLQRKFNEAREERMKKLKELQESHPDIEVDETDLSYDRNLKQAYDNSIQIISQIEIMANGASYAQKKYGIDIFSNDDPSKLDLSLDLERGAVQVPDIVESLEAHASEDGFKKGVELNIGETIPENKNSWVLSRIPEGDWFFSSTLDGNDNSEKLDATDPNEPPRVESEIQMLYRESSAPEREGLNQSHFAKRVMLDVRTAIRSYERTMDAKVSPPKPPPPISSSTY